MLVMTILPETSLDYGMIRKSTVLFLRSCINCPWLLAGVQTCFFLKLYEAKLISLPPPIPNFPPHVAYFCNALFSNLPQGLDWMTGEPLGILKDFTDLGRLSLSLTMTPHPSFAQCVGIEKVEAHVFYCECFRPGSA
jgi:hypothetical protein